MSVRINNGESTKKKKEMIEEETFEEIGWGLDISFVKFFGNFFVFYFSLFFFGFWFLVLHVFDRSKMEAGQDETLCKETGFEWELDERVGRAVF
ncbi:hypothetical protein PP707_01900 [Acetobacter pasteurianus]|nr:hypothetical protein [Acetobacter pasteurianus]